MWGVRGVHRERDVGAKPGSFTGILLRCQRREKGEGRTETRQCKPDSERVRGTWRSQSPELSPREPSSIPRESDGQGRGAHSGLTRDMVSPSCVWPPSVSPGVSAWMSPRPGRLPHSRPPGPSICVFPPVLVPCPSRPLHSGCTRSGLVYGRSLEPRGRSVNVVE